MPGETGGGQSGKMQHSRQPASVDNQAVGDNRDVIVSSAIFNLDAGPATITLPDAGKRFMSTQVAHAIQDAIRVNPQGGVGKFEVPDWDTASQKKVRDALIVLGTTMPDYTGAFGKGAGESRAAPDRHGYRLGRQSGERCALSQRHTKAQRRKDHS
jgi:hypothetical protein